MAYVKQTWKDLPDTTTPLTAERLNHMEDGISESTIIQNALGLTDDTYDSTQTYAVGDMVVKDHVIYECNTADTTGTWDSTKWDVVPIITN